MNIIIPMAGRGQRFKDAGYKQDKPFIDVNGKPMLQVALENLNIRDATYYFLVCPNHVDLTKEVIHRVGWIRQWFIRPMILKVQGAVPACLGLQYDINPMEPLIIANCDQIIDWNPLDFLGFVSSNPDIAGCIPTFEADSPQHSYARCGGIDGEIVIETAEKKVISHHALCGVHYWNKACLAFWSFNKTLLGEPHFNGDYYIAPTFNELIRINANVYRYKTDGMVVLGTPHQLEEYLENSRTD